MQLKKDEKIVNRVSYSKKSPVYEDICFSTIDEANKFMEIVTELFNDQDGLITVLQFYNIAGKKTYPEQNNYGWLSLSEMTIKVEHHYNGTLCLNNNPYYVNMPDPIPLNSENTPTEFTKVDAPIGSGRYSTTDDHVYHPSHYSDDSSGEKDSTIECIDAIRASMTPDEFGAFCKGNVIKYLWRYEKKGGVEDLYKARVYLNWMINTMKGENLNK